MRYFEVHVGTRYLGEDWFEYWQCEGDIRDVWNGKFVNEIMEDNARYWWDVSGVYEIEPFDDWLDDCYCNVTELKEETAKGFLEEDWNIVIWDESYEDGDDEGWKVIMKGETNL